MARLRSDSVFCHVSGEGTDCAEKSRMMWARAQGTPLYRAIYSIVGVMYPLFAEVAPAMVTTSEVVGKAMIAVVRAGGPARVIETRGINAPGSTPGAAP